MYIRSVLVSGATSHRHVFQIFATLQLGSASCIDVIPASTEYLTSSIFTTPSTEYCSFVSVLAGSPSRGGDVAVYVIAINQPSLPTAFDSVLVSISFFVALSTVFHSIKSPDNSSLSHSVLPVLFLPYGSFQLYISL